MRLGPTFALAARRLLRRPMRSFLLLQGTVWGVAVAIFPSAVIEGTKQAALERGRAIGADRISIAPDPTASSAVALGRADVEAVRSALAGNAIATPEVAGARLVALAPTDQAAALLAASPQAPVARGLELAAGRWLLPTDPPQACVVEAKVGAWLGRGELSPGDNLRFPGVDEDLVVVGVAAPRTAEQLRTNDMGFDLGHSMYRKVAERLVFALGGAFVVDDWKRSDRSVWVLPRGEAVDWIFVRVGTTDVSRAASLARNALTDRGQAVVSLYPIGFQVLLSGQVDRFAAVDLALFLACLTMGAVVMMNLGLLTVLRRTREIAIRRVEGATRGDVARHFLLEGLLLTLVGCALGVALGLGLAAFRASLQPMTGFTWTVPVPQICVAVGVSVAIGLLATALPAMRAAALDPAEGLVDE